MRSQIEKLAWAKLLGTWTAQRTGQTFYLACPNKSLPARVWHAQGFALVWISSCLTTCPKAWAATVFAADGRFAKFFDLNPCQVPCSLSTLARSCPRTSSGDGFCHRPCPAHEALNLVASASSAWSDLPSNQNGLSAEWQARSRFHETKSAAIHAKSRRSVGSSPNPAASTRKGQGQLMLSTLSQGAAPQVSCF